MLVYISLCCSGLSDFSCRVILALLRGFEGVPVNSNLLANFGNIGCNFYFKMVEF